MVAPLGEESLHSKRPLYVGCRCLDSHEGVQGGVQLIPFVSVATWVPDLQVADPWTSDLTGGRDGLDRGSDLNPG
jgi:hypothetical protein